MNRPTVSFIVLAILAASMPSRAMETIPLGSIISASQSSSYGASTAWLAVDGNRNNGWLTSGNALYESALDDTPWISFTFDQVYAIDHLVIWNYYSDENGRGIRFAEILVSTADIPTDDSFISLGVKEFGLRGVLYRPDEEMSHLVDLGGAEAKTIKFLILENWFGTVFRQGLSYENWFPNRSCAALSEVEFHLVQVPEPATMSLLALGGLALLRRKK